jgi:hypothetical protein
VAEWVAANGADKFPNVVFINSDEYVSSYALVEKAHFVIVYNSSIGLEASIMGKPVLSGGAARYTQYPTVFLPKNAAEFRTTAQTFLDTPRVEQPVEFVREARRVLYFQLFRTSLPFGDYLEPHGRMGYVRLKGFDAGALRPAHSAAVRAIRDGLMDGKPFLV